ncbi:MAG: hypothetical protein ISR65_09020 [Bacteriovoracaceae bacterium]|nr:hypothetical protein [Bacteriovoracaceae bacterium]
MQTSKKALLISVSISSLVILFAFIYYKRLNSSEDPRVLDAKIEYMKFPKLVSENKFDDALAIIEQTEKKFLATPGYENSFELALFYNDKASVYITRVETQYLKKSKLIGDKKKLKGNLEAYLAAARRNLEKALAIQNKWAKWVRGQTKEGLRRYLAAIYNKENIAFDNYDVIVIKKRRIEDILKSSEESNRRLSVIYTNLGIVERYVGNPKKSMEYYQKAISLWKDNHVAKNNLNILQGKPLEKRNIIKQLFPDKR